MSVWLGVLAAVVVAVTCWLFLAPQNPKNNTANKTHYNPKTKTPFPKRKEIAEVLKVRGFDNVLVGVSRKNPSRIFYKVKGQGSKRLVMCMGMGSRGDIWKNVVKRLLEDASVQLLLIDNRGVGESESKSTLKFGRYTTLMMAQDTQEVIDHLRWETFHLLGHSMGGMVAQRLALLCLDRVQSLTLMATHFGEIYTSFPSAYCLSMHLKGLLFKKRTLEEYLPDNMKLMQGSNVHNNKDEYERVYRAKLTDKSVYGKTNLQGFRCWLSQIMAVFAHGVREDELQHLRLIPSQILTGNEDNLIHWKNSEKLSEIINGKLHVWEGCGHALCRERPHEIASLVHAH
eukprot:CAMPEP_0197521032 /NCGR_PEP_ID=MMETSP1318-20131121/6336_1 /TAXON_ID=552666 /ORGANISM="Partenskyella glossopodia, Strain RCC365" /LENGTH=342 /DNA_ID=CAMNT_0043072841 /DNA_START=32 /DNA_END=1057 /DNA_ORIENTATION=-